MARHPPSTTQWPSRRSSTRRAIPPRFVEAETEAFRRSFYCVTWSQEDGEHVGLCTEFPSLSWLASTPEAALAGIRKTVARGVADMKRNREEIPVPLAERAYRGQFKIRLPPQVHRALALQANRADWMKLDPEVKCYMPGIPRATYQPFPFQIVQSNDDVLFAYEFASASRVVRLNTTEKSAGPSWMGWSVGKWEGESLVIEVTDLVPDTWFDRAGNYHSDALEVTERYTPIDANTLQYEATIEDPQVFSKPWTISMPLYRRREPNMQLMEYKCVPFAEELMYGHLRKKP